MRLVALTSLYAQRAELRYQDRVAQYSELKPVAVPELDAGLATVEIAVVKNSKHPSAALKFARYLTARDKGLEIFRATGFEVLDGDVWDETPEITFFAGAVNRAALEPVIKEFERREGVTVNTPSFKRRVEPWELSSKIK